MTATPARPVAGAPAQPTPGELPLDLQAHVREPAGETGGRSGSRLPRRLLLLVPVLMFTGAVLGMYFQPPALRGFYAISGLKPGGGSASPIAVPPEIVLPQDMAETLLATDVVGLARLLPRGDVSIVAAPYGAGDARVADILVSIGDRVVRGTPVARLDNRHALESAVSIGEANLAVREAALLQTRSVVQSSHDEAKAALDQALSAARQTRAELERAEELHRQRVTTQSALDAARAADEQARLAVIRARATLGRFTALAIDDQPDVIVARRNVEAARADLERARRDLSRAVVTAPVGGTVLDIHARPGQRPGAEGIMEIGDTDQMLAEVEVYQDRIGRVAVGQPVELAANALGRTLQGRVESIGLVVGRQGLVSDDAAANTDARVIRVMVRLDEASSPLAARFTNLEVIARIDTGARAPGQR